MCVFLMQNLLALPAGSKISDFCFLPYSCVENDLSFYSTLFRSIIYLKRGTKSDGS